MFACDCTICTCVTICFPKKCFSLDSNSIFIIDEIAKKLGVTIEELMNPNTSQILEEKINKELKSEIFNLEKNTQNILSLIQKLKNRIEN